jgi:hypothetical protein
MLKYSASFKNISNICARAYISDPKCTDCKHFVPSEKSPNTPDLGKCKLFGHTQGNTFFPYYANSCRVHWLDNYCGKNGRFFELN